MAFLPFNDAVFGGGSDGIAGTVSLGAPLGVNSLLFNTPFAGNYTTSNNTLTLGGAGKVTANADATIGSVVAGSSGLTEDGNATLTLTGANTYTGNTNVNAGTLSVGNGGTSESINTASNISVASGATLEFNNDNQAATKTIANNLSGSSYIGVSWI